MLLSDLKHVPGRSLTLRRMASHFHAHHSSLLTSGEWAAENYVLFCPGMDAAAMRTVELLRFYFGGRPKLFLYGASGIGQL